jgi:hypothetical protein
MDAGSAPEDDPMMRSGMSTSTASRAQLDFDRALTTLNMLVDYARHKRETAPADLPHLSKRAATILNRPAGRDVARTWSVIFDDTIRLVNEYEATDDRETEEVTKAVLRATEALTARLDSLGERLQA